MKASPAVLRDRFGGVAEILKFNWHWYVVGVCCIVAALLFSIVAAFPGWLRLALAGGASVALFWAVVSLYVSHWVYDCSPLRKWTWTKELFEMPPHRWCNIHCGLDQSSARLRTLFPNTETKVLDIFNRTEMTEHAIARARRYGVPATKANFRKLSLAEDSVDGVFLLFAAHELRRARSRREFFNEVARVLSSHGRIILAEHLRDVPNLCAFGPGAFHFFSRREWLQVFDHAGLAVDREFAITPFVRVFVLRRTK